MAGKMRRAGLGLAFGTALILSGTASHAADTITFGHVGAPSAIVWPLYIGLDQGFFDERNIKLDIIFARSSPQVLQQLTAGAFDMGDTGAFDPVRGIAAGANIAILAIESSPAPYSLLARPGIANIKQLAGKTIAVGGKIDIARLYFDRMLEANGLHDSDIDALATDSTTARFAALESKTVAAAMLSAPASFHASADGFTTLGLAADYVKDFPFGTLDVGRSWAATNAPIIKRFMAAYLKSVAWFYDDKNRDPAIRIMAAASNTDIADNSQSYDYYRKIGFFERSGTVSAAALKSLVAVLQKNGELQDDIAPEKLVMPGVTQLVP
jgi:NitT/TauT family transport system substrate-binding protein